MQISLGKQACAIVLADTNYPVIVRAQFEMLCIQVEVTHAFFETKVQAQS